MTEPEVPTSLAARRRVVMLAIRRGDEKPPEGMEEAAVRVAMRQASLKWITWLYMFGFFIEVALVLTAKTDSARILNVVLAAMFFFVARTQYRAVRRSADALDRWAPRVDGPTPGTPDPGTPDPGTPDPGTPQPSADATTPRKPRQRRKS